MIQLGEHKEKQKAILCSHNGSVSQKTLGIEVNGFSCGLLLLFVCLLFLAFIRTKSPTSCLVNTATSIILTLGTPASLPFHG